MPNRVQWDPDHSTGDETLDGQHREILAQCNALADCLSEAGEEGDRRFRKVFDGLMSLAREHFAAEEAALGRCAHPMLEAHREERDEFDYLATEIVTAKNFDKHELQRFLALWWTGHVVGFAKAYRAMPERQPAG